MAFLSSFSPLAWGYDTFMNFWGLNRYQEIARLLAPQAEEWIADLGCGTGGLCRFLLSSGAQFVLLDSSPEMLSRVPQSPQVTPQRGDLRNTAIASQSMDGVVLSDIIHHIPDRSAVYREAFRLLKPRGRLIINDFLPQGFRNALLQGFETLLFGPITYLDPQQEISLLETLGFSQPEMTTQRGLYQIRVVKL